MSDFSTPPAPAPQPGEAPPAGFGPPVPPQGQPQGQWAVAGQPQAPYGGCPVTGAGQAVDEGKPGLAIVAGIGAMIVSAAVYAAIIDATKHQYSYLALLAGLLVGLALGKIGGRNTTLPFVAVVLALVGIFLGQLFGEALLGAKALDTSVTTILFQQTGSLFDAWRADNLDGFSVVFYLIGGAEAFVFTRRFSGAVMSPRARRR